MLAYVVAQDRRRRTLMQIGFEATFGTGGGHHLELWTRTPQPADQAIPDELVTIHHKNHGGIAGHPFRRCRLVGTLQQWPHNLRVARNRHLGNSSHRHHPEAVSPVIHENVTQLEQLPAHKGSRHPQLTIVTIQSPGEDHGSPPPVASPNGAPRRQTSCRRARAVTIAPGSGEYLV